MDCMDFMKLLPDKAFDLAIVDPPYGISIAENMGKRKKNSTYEIKKRVVQNGMLPPPTQGYFKELFRVSKQQIIWGGNYFELPPCKGFIIWQKPGISEEVSFAMCEFAWTSFDITAKVVSVNWERDRIHPTQKPVDLYKWLLRRFAKPGDKILDTHLGSGSSRIAAHEMGYDFVGTEIDKRFFALQEERFKQACEQQSLFEVDGGMIL
ncbi:MAG: site-specific DNA-methyltransferase [Elusimicrobiaceae bacterium]|nr:site-specific DNA-methyltransferase [Elusimicrobiaceae bacterium]